MSISSIYSTSALNALTQTTSKSTTSSNDLQSFLTKLKSTDPSLASKISADIKTAIDSAKSSGSSKSDIGAAVTQAVASDLSGLSSSDQSKVTAALGTNVFKSDGSVDTTKLSSAIKPKGPRGPKPPDSDSSTNSTSSTSSTSSTTSSTSLADILGTSNAGSSSTSTSQSLSSLLSSSVDYLA